MFESLDSFTTEVYNISDNVTEAEGNDKKAVSILYGFLTGVGSLGLVTNCCTLLVLLATKGFLKQPAGVFIINQTVTDLITSTMVITTYVSRMAGVAIDGLFGELYCRLVRSDMLLWTGLVASTFNLVCLSLDRYLQVVHPFFYKRHVSTKKVKVLVIFTWFLSACFHVHHTLLAENIEGKCVFDNSVLQDPHIQRVLLLVHTFLIYHLPMALLTYCYCRIILTIRKRIRARRMGISGREPASLNRAQINTIKTFFIIAILFVFCWSPSQVYCFLFAVRGYIGLEFSRPFADPCYKVALVLALFNVCINPLVYTFKYNEFQQRLKQIFHHCSRREASGDLLAENGLEKGDQRNAIGLSSLTP